MPADSPTETCPSCHKGIFVRTEVRADNVRTKHFSCGHAKHEVELEGKLDFHASLAYKAKPDGKGKPYLEGKTGEDLHRRTGKWMLLERVIDRAKNLYREIVKDPDTGKVVHRCEEPLTQHRGHGSAKKKEKPKGRLT